VQELVNTADHEHGRELLATTRDLAAWLVSNGLARRGTRIGPGDLRRALELREALRALLIANSGSRPPPDALATLRRAADRAGLTIQFGARGGAELEATRGGADGAFGRILAIVFVAMADGSWPRLKACPNCAWAFYDYSRNRSAIWCSMALCGNRLKTRAYRRRKAHAP
jgi:predicted RNA-binding Zn ribbon-like protein